MKKNEVEVGGSYFGPKGGKVTVDSLQPQFLTVTEEDGTRRTLSYSQIHPNMESAEAMRRHQGEAQRRAFANRKEAQITHFEPPPDGGHREGDIDHNHIFVKCPRCETIVRDDNLMGHLNRMHRSVDQKSKATLVYKARMKARNIAHGGGGDDPPEPEQPAEPERAKPGRPARVIPTETSVELIPLVTLNIANVGQVQMTLVEAEVLAAALNDMIEQFYGQADRGRDQ